MRRPVIIKIIIAVLAFIAGFCGHIVWMKRKQIIDVLEQSVFVLSRLIIEHSLAKVDSA